LVGVLLLGTLYGLRHNTVFDPLLRVQIPLNGGGCFVDAIGHVTINRMLKNNKWLAPTTDRGQPWRTRDGLHIEHINGAPNQILGAN